MLKEYSKSEHKIRKNRPENVDLEKLSDEELVELIDDGIRRGGRREEGGEIE
jgi:hypothetical protein